MIKKILLIIVLCLSVLFCSLLGSGTVFADSNEIELSDIACADFSKSDSPALASNAKASYLMDYYSKTVIFANCESERRQIASMTKIMLLNLIFEAIENNSLSFDEQITVSENASSMGGSQVFLQANQCYKVDDLIKSIIVASANDASVALAERLYGSQEACVAKMNDKREQYGMTNTLFANVTGLPHVSQYSCAKDVAAMLCELLTHNDYFRYSKIYLDSLTHPDSSVTTLTNTNKLVKFYDGCDGGKTGYTNEAGSCIAATAKRGDSRFIAVVMGEPDSKTRNKEVSQMFDYGFANYFSKKIISSSEALTSGISVKGGKNSLNAGLEKDFCVFAKKGEKVDYSVDISVDKNLKAPIRSGEKVGVVTVYVGGVKRADVDLVALENVEKSRFIDRFKDLVKNLTAA